MRKIVNSLFAIGLVLAFCSEDDPLPQGGNPDDHALVIQTELNSMELHTKAMLTGTAFSSGAKIGVTMLNSTGGAYDGQTYNNIAYTYNGSAWTGSTIYLSPTAGKVYAYHPYDADRSNISAIALSATTGLASGGTDFMYATPANVTQTSRTATLVMKHALTAVSVTINRGTYTGTGTITGMTWTSSSAGTGGTLNATNGTINNPTGGGTTFNSGLTSSATTNVSNGSTYTFMVVPTATNAPVNFSVTMDGQTYTVSSGSIKMESGTKYAFTLTMDSKTMSVSGVTVNTWTTSDKGELKPSF